MTTQSVFEPLVARLRARDIADTSDIRQLAEWLDSRFEIPGTRLRFGFDSIIGLIPGIGDLATTFLGAYIVLRARELGAPPLMQARMVLNLAIDALVGAIPLLGDIFDLAFKSHVRNVRMLLRHLDEQRSA
ncbi:DUF4112 domain-containing protein [Vitreimonas sp.]|uniref:DUF4112 domain-containing protein n=1 Tax=Vitreimonas sp. TaxID=3069702 RepID=UPI002ED78143